MGNRHEVEVAEDAYLDVCIFRCPFCGMFYAEASWYAIGLASDVECGKCKRSFNPVKSVSERFLLKFSIDQSGKAEIVEKAALR